MQITLYKNCPIPDDYSVVWNNSTTIQYIYSQTLPQTALKKMLASLTQTTITINDIYLDDNGELILDLEDVDNAIWFMDYNYMSFEIQCESGNSHKVVTGIKPSGSGISFSYYSKQEQSTGNYLIYNSAVDMNDYIVYSCNYLQRYAFIDSVQYFNDSIKIKYKCDIYSTYMPFVTYGIGTMTRFSDEQLYHIGVWRPNVPITVNEPLFSNKPLKKYNLWGNQIMFGNPFNYDQQCFCLATVQYYTLDAQGKQTDRRLDTIIIGKGSSTIETGFTYLGYIKTASAWEEDIVKVISKQSIFQVDTDTYFEIQNLYLYPAPSDTNNPNSDYKLANWIDNACSEPGFTNYKSCPNLVQTVTNEYFYFLSMMKYTSQNSLARKFDLCTGSVSNEYDRVGIGFYTHMIPIECNNPLTMLNYSISIAFDSCNIRFFVECINKIIEVTEDLEIKIPVQIATADVTQLQAIQREIASKKNVSNATFGVLKGIGTIAAGAAAASNATTGVGAAAGAGGIVSGLLGAAQNVTNALLDDKLINAKAYTSNSSIDAESVGFINAANGFIDFRLNEPLNTKQFKMMNLRKGYIYNSPNDIKYDGTIQDQFYNFHPNGAICECCDAAGSPYIPDEIRFMQMKEVYINGTFSQEIRNSLIRIINNGFRLVTSKHATDYESYL